MTNKLTKEIEAQIIDLTVSYFNRKKSAGSSSDRKLCEVIFKIAEVHYDMDDISLKDVCRISEEVRQRFIAAEMGFTETETLTEAAI